MIGELELFSETLGRNTIYKKTYSVSRLPQYLIVHFVRFYWKKESEVAGTKAGKSKILKVVILSFRLLFRLGRCFSFSA